MTVEFRQQVAELENSDMPHETIADTIEAMQWPIEVKGANVAAYALTLDAEIAALKEVEGKVAAKRKSRESAASRLRAYLKNNMAACGITEIKALDGTFTAKLFRERDAVVIIDSENLIPADYMRQIPARSEPDKSLLLRALKEGYSIPGVSLTKKDRLEIK
jgi:hypothetical protein